MTLNWTFQTHLPLNRLQTRVMKYTWMPDLTRRRWSRPSANSCSCWRSKRRKALRTRPVRPPHSYTCLSLHKGPLAPFCGGGYGGWFSPSTGRRSGRYVRPVGVAPVLTRSGPQDTNLGYPGLSQFIWWYRWLNPDIKCYPVFRWIQRGVTRPAAAARQPGEEMNETYGMSASEVISQDNPV